MPRIAQAILGAVMLLFAGILIVTSVSVGFILPDHYVSTVRIRTGTQDPTLLRTQIEEINSASILSQVITNLHLNKKWGDRYKEGNDFRTEDSTMLLRSQTKISQIKGTYLIQISVTDEERGEAANIANGIATVYINCDLAPKSPPALIVEAALPAALPESQRSNFALLLSAIIAGVGLFLLVRSGAKRRSRPPLLNAPAVGKAK
jgi:capsular polysaccharide biosynthesis protein